MEESKVVKVLREERGYTMRALNELVGCSPKSKLVSNIEKGKSKIPVDKIYLFSLALQVPIKVIVDLKVENYKKQLEKEVAYGVQSTVNNR